jgi:hypothetical protein
MAYTSYDPRDAIRQKVGTEVFNPTEKKATYCMVVTDTYGKTHNIPMLLSENCQIGSLPEMPYIKMHRAYTTYEPHDINAAVRRMTAYIDMKVYFQNIDGVTPIDFKQAILNALQDAIRTDQEDVTDTFFMNIESERDQEEIDGMQVTFIYIVTLKCDKSDAC